MATKGRQKPILRYSQIRGPRQHIHPQDKPYKGMLGYLRLKHMHRFCRNEWVAGGVRQRVMLFGFDVGIVTGRLSTSSCKSFK